MNPTNPDHSDYGNDDARKVSLAAAGLAFVALFASAAGLGVALSARDAAPGAAAPTPAPSEQSAPIRGQASLTEFAVELDQTTFAAGATIEVANDGAAAHNLWVEGAAARTEDLQPGASGDLDLSGLAAGTYTLYCQLPGHRDAGMHTTITVAGDAVASDDGHGSHDHGEEGLDEAAMLERMVESLTAFPAQTEGAGARLLEPEVLEDGTKLFTLVADEIDWEVEPGKFVEAVGYNGAVPGPTMKVDIGDRVTVRVVNELDDQGTSLHPHGLKDHAFELDGVTFISQDPIAPGEAMDYTFVADKESVVGYHSHHMSLHQVPNGLFGMMIVGDYAELAGIEGVVDEQVMVLNDAGNVGLTLNGKSFPATAPYAYTQGDKVVVHYANEGQMAHPMHLHNQAGTVIAKDGYLLPEAARWQGDTFNIAPGERLTVVYEMTTPGTWVWHCHILGHVKRADGSMFGMLTAVQVDPAD